IIIRYMSLVRAGGSVSLFIDKRGIPFAFRLLKIIVKELLMGIRLGDAFKVRYVGIEVIMIHFFIQYIA
ncbi:MAG: hypothetical protein ACK55Z_16290, partial [bacterium]